MQLELPIETVDMCVDIYEAAGGYDKCLYID